MQCFQNFKFQNVHPYALFFFQRLNSSSKSSQNLRLRVVGPEGYHLTVLDLESLATGKFCLQSQTSNSVCYPFLQAQFEGDTDSTKEIIETKQQQNLDASSNADVKSEVNYPLSHKVAVRLQWLHQNHRGIQNREAHFRVEVCGLFVLIIVGSV